MTGLPPVEVSVIICVRNGATTLRRQLDALSAQVGAPAFEVIISNNGSTDGTQGIAEEWASNALGAVAAAQIIDSGQQPGIPFARNAGARAARGRLLAYCDADDAVKPGWVAAHAAMIQSGLGGGRVEAYRPDGTAEIGAFSDSLMATTYLPHVPGCNFSITRDAFFDVGGFDESLPPYGCDDLEFSWRVQERGYPISYVADAVVRFSITPRTRVVKKEFLMAKARIAVAARHPESERATPTLRLFLGDFLKKTAMLPWRMIRPGSTPRTRWVRWTVDSAGRLAGFWTYFVRREANPPQLLG
ncbi:glycosyltransferase family 2 protein [Tessaracoccus sp. MC1679]|uniref:glycosyltransferase family 2 protein n=1 Tax=Tessaracoccus sp. MC1679 TaxID=2760313 RepID=UPI001603739B|nr:glycosyltransferase family A protein [Tessaracoccus sp. MC1679]MBB1517124.1 glycosyltransferase family 2 protein [Tessaracoccus sp. MC1679]